MELLKITNMGRLFFHLEDMIDADSFNIRSVSEIIQELFQDKEVFMKHLNNFNIISGIQHFTALLKVKTFCFNYSILRLLNAWSQSFIVGTLI